MIKWNKLEYNLMKNYKKLNMKVKTIINNSIKVKYVNIKQIYY